MPERLSLSRVAPQRTTCLSVLRAATSPAIVPLMTPDTCLARPLLACRPPRVKRSWNHGTLIRRSAVEPVGPAICAVGDATPKSSAPGVAVATSYVGGLTTAYDFTIAFYARAPSCLSERILHGRSKPAETREDLPVEPNSTRRNVGGG